MRLVFVNNRSMNFSNRVCTCGHSKNWKTKTSHTQKWPANACCEWIAIVTIVLHKIQYKFTDYLSNVKFDQRKKIGRSLFFAFKLSSNFSASVVRMSFPFICIRFRHKIINSKFGRCNKIINIRNINYFTFICLCIVDEGLLYIFHHFKNFGTVCSWHGF